MVAEAAESDLERIRLALTEACANVIRHAYPDAEGTLDIRICLGPRTVMIEVRDRGVGVGEDPAPQSGGPGGLGLPLIDMLADRVEIRPCVPGTSVRMTFDLR
jgi:serine/threonine-protein kinase RsbW